MKNKLIMGLVCLLVIGGGSTCYVLAHGATKVKATTQSEAQVTSTQTTSPTTKDNSSNGKTEVKKDTTKSDTKVATLAKAETPVTNNNDNVATTTKATKPTTSDKTVANTKVEPTQSSGVTYKYVDSYEYTARNCTMFKDYSTSSDIVSLINGGTKIYVVENYSNGWTGIMYNGNKGYILTSEVVPGEGTSTQPTSVKSTTQTKTTPTTKVASQSTSTQSGKPSVSPMQTSPIYKYAYVPVSAKDGVAIMVAPDEDKVLTTLYSGASMYVQTVANGWAKVVIDAEIGYVPYSEITFVNPNQAQLVPPNYSSGDSYQYVGKTGEITSTTNLYGGPNTADKTIFSNVKVGTEFQVQYKYGDWYLVNYGEPNLLYVPVNDVSLVGGE